MNIYVQIDELRKVIAFNVDQTVGFKQAELNDDLFVDFIENASFYKLDDNNYLYKDIELADVQTIAKKRCLEKFELYVKAISPYTTEELILNNMILKEIYGEVEKGTSAPMTEYLASCLGITNIDDFKRNKREEIEHYYYTLTYLVSQKIKMYNFIENCQDPEILDEMEFNFSWATFSNMRWS